MLAKSAAVLATLLLSASPALATTYVWDMDITEDQVNNSGVGDGSTDSTATGHAIFRYDTNTERLAYEISWNGLQGLLTAIHIHGPALPSESVMPHLFNVFNLEADVIAAGVDRTTDTVSDLDFLGTIIVEGSPNPPFGPDEVAAHMIDEMGYVNVHSDLWPAGEIRGNLVLVDQLEEQTKSQQKCTNALNKDFAKLAKARGKQICSCIKDGTKGALQGTIEDCLDDDPKLKLSKLEGKLSNGFAKKCVGQDKDGVGRFPPFGSTTELLAEATIIAEYDAKELGLIHDVFGPDLDLAIADETTQPEEAKCQVKLAKAVKKCQDTKLAVFNKCKKDGLKGKPGLTFVEAADVEACMGQDPKLKVDRACSPATGKIFKAIDKTCDGVASLSATVAGCGSDDPAVVSACLNRLVECRVCLALNAVDGLSRDCDDFDDGLANLSCQP